MKDNKCVFIVNPIAGNGYAGKYVGKVREIIETYNLNADIVFTEKKRHATELADRFYNDGYFVGIPRITFLSSKNLYVLD